MTVPNKNTLQRAITNVIKEYLGSFQPNNNNQTINDIGINSSGDVYIVLENGIIINSSFGQRVTFTVMDHKDDDQEKDFDNYYLAENYLNTL